MLSLSNCPISILSYFDDAQQVDNVVLLFRMLRPLVEFVAALHRNGTEDRCLQGCVRTTVVEGEQQLVVSLEFPDEGQYGLDIYTREAHQPAVKGKHLLTHCCKYLINSRVE